MFSVASFPIPLPPRPLRPRFLASSLRSFLDSSAPPSLYPFRALLSPFFFTTPTPSINNYNAITQQYTLSIPPIGKPNINNY